jgi:hypothetical protein
MASTPLHDLEHLDRRGDRRGGRRAYDHLDLTALHVGLLDRRQAGLDRRSLNRGGRRSYDNQAEHEDNVIERVAPKGAVAGAPSLKMASVPPESLARPRHHNGR